MTHDPFCDRLDMLTLIETDRPNVYQTERLCVCREVAELRISEWEKAEKHLADKVLTVKKKKNQEVTQEEPNTEKHDEMFTRGYNQAVRDMAWTCTDCGNTYESHVDECPNKILDEIATWERAHNS